MSEILDSNNRPIPLCNVIKKEENIHLYVEDQPLYKEYVKSNYMYKNISIFSCLITSLFFFIFTLNFSSNAWSMGNLFTFIIIIIGGSVTFYSVQKFFTVKTLLDQIITSGSPCLTTSESSNHVHCKSNPLDEF